MAISGHRNLLHSANEKDVIELLTIREATSNLHEGRSH